MKDQNLLQRRATRQTPRAYRPKNALPAGSFPLMFQPLCPPCALYVLAHLELRNLAALTIRRNQTVVHDRQLCSGYFWSCIIDWPSSDKWALSCDQVPPESTFSRPFHKRFYGSLSPSSSTCGPTNLATTHQNATPGFPARLGVHLRHGWSAHQHRRHL